MNQTSAPDHFKHHSGTISLALTALLLHGGLAGATELGGSSYPVGVELGYGDMLPPGLYNLAYYSHGQASSLKGSSGQDLGWARYRLTADTISYRMQYVWATTLLGGTAESALVLPFPYIDVRPAWAQTCGCKSRHELVTVSEVKRNCMRVTECGEEAWSVNREPMDKNRIEGAAKQGERASIREALVTKAKRRRCGGCAMKVCVLTWGDLASCLKG